MMNRVLTPTAGTGFIRGRRKRLTVVHLMSQLLPMTLLITMTILLFLNNFPHYKRRVGHLHTGSKMTAIPLFLMEEKSILLSIMLSLHLAPMARRMLPAIEDITQEKILLY